MLIVLTIRKNQTGRLIWSATKRRADKREASCNSSSESWSSKPSEASEQTISSPSTPFLALFHGFNRYVSLYRRAGYTNQTPSVLGPAAAPGTPPIFRHGYRHLHTWIRTSGVNRVDNPPLPTSSHQRQSSIFIKQERRRSRLPKMNTANARKSLLIKCVIGAICLLGLLYMLFPDERYSGFNSDLSDADRVTSPQAQAPPAPAMETETDDKQMVADDEKEEQKVVPVEEEEKETEQTVESSSTSISADSSSSSSSSSGQTSEHCTTPHPGRPLLQYALMIDAGSSGSRIHVYRFNYCREEPELEDEVFYPIQPGLSSYENDPEGAAKSLDELMEVALQNVPKELHHCTPIMLKATAGLRLLGEGKSKRILDAVRTRLEDQYPFPIAGGERGVEIMDGKDEGVYAWITVNYLLGKLSKNQRGHSAAVFDLGGASTQIVFEPTFDQDDKMAEGEHKYLLNYGEGDYTLYQHSYLGYGLNEARKRVKAEMIELWKEEAKYAGRVYHPCLPEGHQEVLKQGNETVTLTGTGAGHAECRGVVERVFNKDKSCVIAPCAFDGMYQPSISDTFSGRELYVFSYFYDLTQPLGMPSEFSVQELGELTRRVCDGDTQPFRHIPGALEVLQNTKDYCLDLTYIHGLLRIGYDIPPDRLVRTAKKIRGAETGWCLGASIAMIDEAQICRIN
ncbi:nucleoside phosphatase family-domain-containing protein [Dichotomocladium elegans]|nr:nucleoside phosphatase family-domain-containing protein [Dichotomocladium elegans]